MKKRLKNAAILTRPGSGFMGGALLVMLAIISPIHAGWLVEDQMVLSSDGAEGDSFGNSVAVFGDTAVIGAPGDDDAGENSGSAYVFVRNGATWNERSKLTASNWLGESDAAAGDQFGSSVAIVDGLILVGASGDDDGSGSAYFYYGEEGRWHPMGRVKASDAATGDGFGGSVALTANRAVVGAAGNDHAGNNSGSAYAFIRSISYWYEQTKLVASDAAEEDRFGESVAIDYSNNGSVVVGASGNDDAGDNSGSAYVFVHSGNYHDANWSEQTKLTASDAAEDDYFGYSVAASDNSVVVGAYMDDEGLPDPEDSPAPPQDVYYGSGSAYVFVRDGVSWSEEAKLLASDRGEDDHFGWSVAISGDMAVVGAPDLHHRDSHFGASYLFVRNEETWTERPSFLISIELGEQEHSGNAVAISGDIAVVGVSQDKRGGLSGIRSGSAYVYDLACDIPYSLSSNQWRQISLPCNPGEENTVIDLFGDDELGAYGTDWVLYRYEDTGYVALKETDTLSQFVGYWIIQNCGSDKALDMPSNSTPSQNHTLRLATRVNAAQWNMIGYPFKFVQSLSSLWVSPAFDDEGLCNGFCNLDTAQSDRIVHNELWTYNQAAGYTKLSTSDNFEPWAGYWLVTLERAGDLQAVDLRIWDEGERK